MFNKCHRSDPQQSAGARESLETAPGSYNLILDNRKVRLTVRLLISMVAQQLEVSSKEVMGVPQARYPPSHHHFYRWYGCHSQSWVVYDTIEVDDLRVPPWLWKPPSKVAHKIYVTHIVVARMVVIHIPLVWSVKCLCSVNANCFGAVRRHFCWWNPFRSTFVLVKFELPMDSHGQVMVQSPFFTMFQSVQSQVLRCFSRYLPSGKQT